MQNKFDKIIIRDFRKTVTGNNSFVRHHFTEYTQLKDNNKKIYGVKYVLAWIGLMCL